MDVAEAIDRTHDELLFKGRSRQWGDDAGPMCVLHAISNVAGDNDFLFYATKSAIDRATREKAHRCNVVAWNFVASDDEMLDLLRNTAKELREEASA